jgi:hypothetical protein
VTIEKRDHRIHRQDHHNEWPENFGGLVFYLLLMLYDERQTEVFRSTKIRKKLFGSTGLYRKGHDVFGH